MEERELMLLEKLAPEHPELKDLWDEHMLFTRQLEKLESKPYRTPVEEQEMKALKVQKLDNKTKMLVLLENFAKKA